MATLLEYAAIVIACYSCYFLFFFVNKPLRFLSSLLHISTVLNDVSPTPPK